MKKPTQILRTKSLRSEKCSKQAEQDCSCAVWLQQLLHSEYLPHPKIILKPWLIIKLYSLSSTLYMQIWINVIVNCGNKPKINVRRVSRVKGKQYKGEFKIELAIAQIDF